MSKSLSIAVTCSKPYTMMFPLFELLQSVSPIADEIIIVNGDESYGRFGNSEVDFVVEKFLQESDYTGELDQYHLPWRDSFRKNMSLLAKTAAISQCTKDYVLWLDADEIIHEEDHDKIRRCMSLGEDAYSFSTIHFYRDFDTVKISGDRSGFYNWRPKLFKNHLGIWDGYQSWLGYHDFSNVPVVKREYTADLVTWDYEPVHKFSKKVNVNVYHYGWTRPDYIMLDKQNKIESRHHPHYQPLTEWVWDMSFTREFTKTHPAVMREWIERYGK